MSVLIVPTAELEVRLQKSTAHSEDSHYRNLLYNVLAGCNFRGVWTATIVRGYRMHSDEHFRLLSGQGFGLAIAMKPGSNDTASRWRISIPKEYTVEQVHSTMRDYLRSIGGKQKHLLGGLQAKQPLPDVLVRPQAEESPVATPVAPREPAIAAPSVATPDTDVIAEDSDVPDIDINIDAEIEQAALASSAGFIDDEEVLSCCFQELIPHLDADNCIPNHLACRLIRKALGISGGNLGASIHGLHCRRYIVISDDKKFYELTRKARALAAKYGPAKPAVSPVTAVTPPAGGPAIDMTEMLAMAKRLNQLRRTAEDDRASNAKMNAHMAKLKDVRADIENKLRSLEQERDALDVEMADCRHNLKTGLALHTEITDLENKLAPFRTLITLLKDAK